MCELKKGDFVQIDNMSNELKEKGFNKSEFYSVIQSHGDHAFILNADKTNNADVPCGNLTKVSEEYLTSNCYILKRLVSGSGYSSAQLSTAMGKNKAYLSMIYKMTTFNRWGDIPESRLSDLRILVWDAILTLSQKNGEIDVNDSGLVATVDNTKPYISKVEDDEKDECGPSEYAKFFALDKAHPKLGMEILEPSYNSKPVLPKAQKPSSKESNLFLFTSIAIIAVIVTLIFLGVK